MSEFLISIILGLVEGITEFIPVSSTGHLIVVGEYLGFQGEKSSTFEIFIQSGAILAIVILFRQKFFNLLRPQNAAAGMQGRSGLIRLGIACLPFVILGALFGKKVKALLFTTGSVSIALVVGGIVMLLVERRKREGHQVLNMDDISLRQAFIIGVCQCAALWPGISRSGATLVGASLLGIGRTAAAEFSFFLAVPILLAATGYDLLKSLHLLSSADIPIFGLGFVVSFLSALVAIKVFLSLLKRWGLEPFAWYRIGLGLLILCCLR